MPGKWLVLHGICGGGPAVLADFEAVEVFGLELGDFFEALGVFRVERYQGLVRLQAGPRQFHRAGGCALGWRLEFVCEG